jgi:hypothetical protein
MRSAVRRIVRSSPCEEAVRTLAARRSLPCARRWTGRTLAAPFTSFQPLRGFGGSTTPATDGAEKEDEAQQTGAEDGQKQRRVYEDPRNQILEAALAQVPQHG